MLCRLDEGQAAGASGAPGAAADTVEHIFEDPEVGCVSLVALDLEVGFAAGFDPETNACMANFISR